MSGERTTTLNSYVYSCGTWCQGRGMIENRSFNLVEFYVKMDKTNRSLCIIEDIRMKINEYQELAMTTLNPELSKRDVLINSVMGLCGESGEAIDIVKNGWLKDMNWTRNIW